MKRFFCLCAFVVSMASATTTTAAVGLVTTAAAFQNISRERDVTIDVCNYHTNEYCEDEWQCCDSRDLESGYCCPTSAYCCISKSVYTRNSLCCTWNRCCPSSTGYSVQCCGYDEECRDHECQVNPVQGLGLGAIIAIAVCGGLLFFVVAAIVIALCVSANRRRRQEKASSSKETLATIQVGVAPPPAYPAAGPPPQQSVDPRLESALQTVRQGIVVALVGIANDRMSVDEAVTLMAMAASQALGKCQCSSQSEFDRAASLVFQYMNVLFAEIIPSMSKEQREALVTTVLQRMTALAQQQKRARLEESLDAIRQTFVTVWMGVTNNKISLDDAQQLMGVAVAAALRNCSISSREQLSAHITAFTQWMVLVADQVAPMLPAEVKRQMIQNIWANATAQF